MRAIRFPLFILLLCVSSTDIKGADLRLLLQSKSETYILGESIRLIITYENTGEEPFYFQRPKGLGADHLNLMATTKEYSCAVEPQYFDAAIEDLHFRFTSLYPGDRLTMDVEPLNDPTGFGMPRLPMATPGRYVLRAVFTSMGPGTEGDRSPVWRGQIESNPVEVILQEPGEDLLAEWRERLRVCVFSPECEDYVAIEYFRFVRDSHAVEYLKQFIRRNPTYDRAVEALVNQGRTADASFLEELVNRPNMPNSLRDHYQEMARLLRNPSPCGW